MNFTYYTIIGRDPSLLEGHLKNVTQYAGFEKLECEKKLLVIVYTNPSIPQTTTDKILSTCKEYGAEPIIYQEPTTIFIDNLYACWNLGYNHALDGLVFRGGSDQVFSKDSFVSLYNDRLSCENDKVILQANTVENADRNLGSRHIVASLGDTFESFNYGGFEGLCETINKEADKPLLTLEDSIRLWNKPTGFTSTLGQINRTDGCSWLMTRKDWEEYGPLPVLENGVTGDVVIHDRFQRNGYESFIVRDCITYHFVRGESKDIQ
tara:strand:- start:6623 stop:7417 length:795 start_codon:yes stop_codon:yes gene_type:complete